MRHSPSAAILRGQWEKTRWVLLATCLAMGAAALALYLIASYRIGGIVGDPSLDFTITALFIAVAALVTIATMLLVHSDAENLSLSLPIRMLRLPLRTSKIVAPIMGYSLVCVGFVSFAATALAKLAIDTQLAWWLPVTVAVCAMAAIQAWALAFGDTNPRTGFAFILACAILIAGLIQRPFVYAIFFESNPAVQTLAVIAVIAVFYAIAVAGVGINRHGGLPDSFRPARRPSSDAPPQPYRPFKSAYQAQLWYDWQCFGWQLPLAVLTILGAYFLGMPLLVALFTATDVTGHSSAEGFSRFFFVDWLTSTQFVTTGLQISALLSALGVGAYLFMKAGHWNVTSTFLLTHPIPTRTLALARLSLAFKSTLMALGLLMAAVAAITGILWLRGDSIGFLAYIEQGYESVPAIGILFFFWGSLFVFMWVALWSMNAGWAMLVFASTLLPLTGVIVLSPQPGETAARLSTVWQTATWGASGVLALGFLWVYIQARKHRLVAGRAHVAAAILWLIGIAAFIVYDLSYELRGVHAALTFFEGDSMGVEPNTWPHPVDWGLWAALSLIPVAPIFTHPYLIHRARHK